MDREHKTVLWVVVAGVALCVAISVITLLWAQNSGDDGAAPPVELSGGRSQGVHAGVVVLEFALLATFVGLAAYAVFQLLRRRAPKFEDLGPDEQRRREEAGRMLHDL